jgi:hypothetical protein
VPLRVIKQQRLLELLVPSLGIDEFKRNRPRAETAVAASVSERFRLFRTDVLQDERLGYHCREFVLGYSACRSPSP